MSTQCKITLYFEEMKRQDLAKKNQSQEDRIEHEIRTSTGSCHRAQTEHKSKTYLEEHNQKKMEKKRKRTEAAAKRENCVVEAKCRWNDNIPAFNPNRGLRDKMLENAQWKHLVNGLNKAFPKPQGNTDSKYGPMNRTDIGEIQKYKALLPQEELDKWRHQNQMIDQVIAMKYDKKSRKWWAQILLEKNPNSFQMAKDILNGGWRRISIQITSK